MMFFTLFLIVQVICQNENDEEINTYDLPFDLIDLHDDWDVLITHSSGLFSDKETRFQIHPKINMYIMKANGSVEIETKATRHISRLYHSNITNNKIELFNINKSLIATITAYRLDNQTVSLRGSSTDGNYSIFGYASPFQKSLITVTSTKSDDVYFIRGIPPHRLTATEFISRILPSIAIVIFMGFGRIYRARFWRQYGQMNTRTLQNRINTASKQKPK